MQLMLEGKQEKNKKTWNSPGIKRVRVIYTTCAIM